MHKVADYINKTIGSFKILDSLGVRRGRTHVLCKCLYCDGNFERRFSSVRRQEIKSCGCNEHPASNKSNAWKGFGEIGSSYFNVIKRGAVKRGLKFKIKIQQIWNLFLKQERKCRLSGVKLTFARSSDQLRKTASLDRIDSDKGYTIGNIQWIHKKVNFMKQNMSDREFLRWVKIIYEYNQLNRKNLDKDFIG